jgi:hypothetical protein
MVLLESIYISWRRKNLEQVINRTVDGRAEIAEAEEVKGAKRKSPLSESNKGPSDDNRTITVRRSKPTELRRD